MRRFFNPALAVLAALAERVDARMALVTRDPNGCYMDGSTGMFAAQITGCIAGENINAVSPCYVKAADGKAYNSNGTAANEAAKFDGFCPRGAVAGQAVTLFSLGARFHYTAAGGLTPGADLFVAATAGGLDTAATIGGVRAIARAIDDTDIRCTKASDQA